MLLSRYHRRVDNPPSQKEIDSIKEILKQWAKRFKDEQKEPVISENKQNAIDLAVKEVKPKDEETFRKRLAHYDYRHPLILQAIAIFKARKQQKPEKEYDHTYFGGILRNLVNDRYLEVLNTNLNDVFYHKMDDLLQRNEKELAKEMKANPVETASKLIKDYLEMPVPAWSNAILQQIKDLFFLAVQGSVETAKDIGEKLSKAILKMTYKDGKKREIVLCRMYEWVNYVQMFGTA